MVKQRFHALDIMRGLTLALMILVNTPGSWSFVYSPLLHADWNGYTPTDFVFPFFLFIVGSALFFSQRSLLQSHIDTSLHHRKILKRTLLLFSIGLFLNIFPFTESLANVRILGVLQRIALAYGIAAFIVMYARFRIRLYISILILLGYWLLLQLSQDPYSLEFSLVRKIDLAVFGAGHLWQGKGIAFDPEGLLSTLPSVVNVLAGFEVARILYVASNHIQAQKKVVIVGLSMIITALIWDAMLPINKSLWTSSFVLLTSGAAIIILQLLMMLEKIPTLESALQQFIPFGKNPLFIYTLSFIWEKLLYTLKYGGQTYYELFYQKLCVVFDHYNASLVFALLHVFIFWCIAKWMDKKNILISL